MSKRGDYSLVEEVHYTDEINSLPLLLTENVIDLSDASYGHFSKISCVGHSKLMASAATCSPHMGSFFSVNLDSLPPISPVGV